MGPCVVSSEEEMDENYAAFMDMLPELLKEHAGRWVILRRGELIEFHDSMEAALQAGEARFADKNFGIQQVSGSILALNWMTCCGS
ncbi:MAG: hypothetical protein HQL77_00315 [Magnetococcales bacterium]|nr:hypothetical protein [Magnetococcales bacterium]